MADATDRHGLALTIFDRIDSATERKLRLNRWWHNGNSNTYFNNDTEVNRKFAEQFTSRGIAMLTESHRPEGGTIKISEIKELAKLILEERSIVELVNKYGEVADILYNLKLDGFNEASNYYEENY